MNEGSTLLVTVEATDDVGVEVVELLVDGQLLSSDALFPYVFEIQVPIGSSSLTLQAAATDAGGNVGVSEERVIDVLINPPPIVSISAPAEGAALIEQTAITIASDASDDGVVESVVFTVNGEQAASFTAPPFSFEFTVPATVSELTFEVTATDDLRKTTAVSRTVEVISDPLTTVTGRVIDAEGAGVGGIEVQAVGLSAETEADGSFSIPDVSTIAGDISVVARGEVDGQPAVGRSARVAPVRGGTTDVGDFGLGVSLLLDQAVLNAPLGFKVGTSGLGLSTGAAGDFDGDGNLDMVVVSGSALTLLRGTSDGSFEAPVAVWTAPLPAGAMPGGSISGGSIRAVLTADFDGDGASDVAVVSADEALVFLGQAEGFPFQEPTSYAVGSDPAALETGDFDGDGSLDLAVLNGGSHDVSILLGNGDGTFQAETQITNVGGSPVLLLGAGDFDRDGLDDIAVARDGGLSVLVGNGDPAGLFESPQDVSVPGGGTLADLVVVEWDDDLEPDIVASNGSQILIFFGDGNGTFAEVVQVSSDLNPAPGLIAAGDFDSDGNQDLAIVDLQAVSLVVKLGTGSRDPVFDDDDKAYVLDPDTSALITGDFDGDSELDIATTTRGVSFFFLPAGSVVLYSNRGDGTFLGKVTKTTVDSVFALQLGNTGPEGVPDLVVAASRQPTVLLRFQQGAYEAAQSFELPPFTIEFEDGTTFDTVALVVQMAAGDLTNSGKDDVVLVTIEQDYILLLLAGEDGLFADPVQINVGTRTFDPLIADFNSDGNQDLVLGTGLHGGGLSVPGETQDLGAGLVLLAGNGDGTFQEPSTILASDFGVHHPAAGDLNGDGSLDLVVSASIQEGRSATGFVLLGNGDGSFQDPEPIPHLTRQLFFATLADLDEDGALDLVTIGLASPGDVLVLLGQGDGTFGASVAYPVGEAIQAVLGDVSGDGVLDIVVIATDVNGVLVFLGNGDGSFLESVIYGAGSAIFGSGIVVTDLNNDGLDDVAVAAFSQHAVIVLSQIPPEDR